MSTMSAVISFDQPRIVGGREIGPTETFVDAGHITTMPGRLGGKPCVAGTRIAVEHVYGWHEVQGRSVAEIVRGWPFLTPADVHAALAYFWDHSEAILEKMAADEIWFQELMRNSPPSILETKLGGGEKVAERLASARAARDAVSP